MYWPHVSERKKHELVGIKEGLTQSPKREARREYPNYLSSKQQLNLKGSFKRDESMPNLARNSQPQSPSISKKSDLND